jgi:hypothetical protein
MSELEQTLTETATLLESAGDTFWSEKIRRQLARGVDPAGVLTWFGGMGSFNDFLFDDPAVNRRLDDLRERIYVLASAANRR